MLLKFFSSRRRHTRLTTVTGVQTCAPSDLAALELLAQAGYDPENGARPLRRVLRTQVEDAAAEALLAGTLKPGSCAALRVEDGSVKLCVEGG